MKRIEKYAGIFAVLAGACDGLTGVLLLGAPLFTLKLMGINSLPTEPIYMQWIGAFVAGVGLSYFLSFLSCDISTRRHRMVGMFEITSLIRIIIAVFTGISVLRGTLDFAWIVVTFTDLALASAQLVFLRLHAFSPDEIK